MHRIYKSAAIALALSQAFITHAAQDEAAVVVTASRFIEVERKAPANVAIITADDIARIPASSLPDLLATRAGVDVRSLYGNQGTDASANLRGFGENGNLRTLVMVDGRKLDSLEFVSANWSSIPLDSIERIEILRGSGTVLHGDQAVAGVINIITRRGKDNAASVEASVGSFGYGKVAASLSLAGDTRVAFNVEHVKSDEYRRRNAQQSTSASGRIAQDMSGGEIYAEIGGSSLDYQLPGFVTAAQYRNDPQAAETNDSWFKRDNAYLRPGINWRFTPTLDGAIELDASESRNKSWISSWPSYRNVKVSSLGLTPRMRWAHRLGSLPSTTIAGIDWSDARLDQDRHASPTAAKTNTVALDRKGNGAYLHNTTQLASGLSLSIGGRSQRYTTMATDTTVSSPSESTARKSASELGLIWQPAAAWKIFAKTSTTFRYPVLDELTTWGGFAAPPPQPESGRGVDLGGEWRAGGHSVQVTFYDLKMKDEIAWNNATSQNENLQQTLHRGIEIDTRWRLAPAWQLNLSWNGKEAKFREGANDGKVIPLVPTDRLTAMLNWNGGTWGSHALLANYVGSRYFGGDEANARDRLPAYTAWSWQSHWKLGQWDVMAKATNLSNKKYSPMAFDYGFGAGYYPANPRAGYLTARYNF